MSKYKLSHKPDRIIWANIPKEFIRIGDKGVKLGYTYRVEYRKKDVVILRCVWNEKHAKKHDPCEEHGVLPVYRLQIMLREEVHFQVHIIRTLPVEIINGYVYPERERLRTQPEWGSYAWTYGRYEDAVKKLKELTK